MGCCFDVHLAAGSDKRPLQMSAVLQRCSCQGQQPPLSACEKLLSPTDVCSSFFIDVPYDKPQALLQRSQYHHMLDCRGVVLQLLEKSSIVLTCAASRRDIVWDV